MLFSCTNSNQTPVKGQDKNGIRSAIQTPNKGQEQNGAKGPSQTPIKGQNQTPAKGLPQTPVKVKTGANQTPAKAQNQPPSNSTNQTPGKGQAQTPAKGGSQTPAKSKNPTPAKGASQTPNKMTVNDSLSKQKGSQSKVKPGSDLRLDSRRSSSTASGSVSPVKGFGPKDLNFDIWRSLSKAGAANSGQDVAMTSDESGAKAANKSAVSSSGFQEGAPNASTDSGKKKRNRNKKKKESVSSTTSTSGSVSPIKGSKDFSQLNNLPSLNKTPMKVKDNSNESQAKAGTPIQSGKKQQLNKLNSTAGKAGSSPSGKQSSSELQQLEQLQQQLIQLMNRDGKQSSDSATQKPAAFPVKNGVKSNQVSAELSKLPTATKQPVSEDVKKLEQRRRLSENLMKDETLINLVDSCNQAQSAESGNTKLEQPKPVNTIIFLSFDHISSWVV